MNLYNRISQEYPVLELGLRDSGYSYIDYLSLDDVTSPIMHGSDRYNRPFIVIKFIDSSGSLYMQTFFQRYSNESKLWMGCGHATAEFLYTTGGIDEDQIALLDELIAGQTIRCTEALINTCRINNTSLNRRIRVVGYPDTVLLLKPAVKYSSETSEESCLICHQVFSQSDLVNDLQCHHIFHSECLQQWINVNEICPLCRKEIVMPDQD